MIAGLSRMLTAPNINTSRKVGLFEYYLTVERKKAITRIILEARPLNNILLAIKVDVRHDGNRLQFSQTT
jgi:hypothetical protein